MLCSGQEYEYIEDIVENLKSKRSVRRKNIAYSALKWLDTVIRFAIFEHKSGKYYYKYIFYSRGYEFAVEFHIKHPLNKISNLPADTVLTFSKY